MINTDSKNNARTTPFTVNDAPKVTIGLPVYNGERFLANAIDSILNQSYDDFELIVSDNASTDGTEAIARQYVDMDKRVHYIRSPQNAGAAMNFNKLVDMARGTYFKWMAHDDTCAPQFLERCIEILECDPEVILAYPKAIDIDEHGRYLHPVYDSHFLLHTDSDKPSERFRYLSCVNHACLSIFGVIRTDVLRNSSLIGPYAGSDRILLAQLGLMGKFGEIQEQLLHHREHSARSTRAMPTLQARMAWFNPTLENKRVFPNWRLFSEYLRIIHGAPISWLDKLRCYVQIARWLRWNNWRLLMDDLTYYFRPSAYNQGAKR